MLVKKSVQSARGAAWVNKAALPCETGLTVSMRSYVDNCVLFPLITPECIGDCFKLNTCAFDKGGSSHAFGMALYIFSNVSKMILNRNLTHSFESTFLHILINL